MNTGLDHYPAAECAAALDAHEGCEECGDDSIAFGKHVLRIVKAILERQRFTEFLGVATKLGMHIEKISRRDGDDELVIYTGWDFNDETEQYEPMREGR